MLLSLYSCGVLPQVRHRAGYAAHERGLVCGTTFAFSVRVLSAGGRVHATKGEARCRPAVRASSGALAPISVDSLCENSESSMPP